MILLIYLLIILIYRKIISIYGKKIFKKLIKLNCIKIFLYFYYKIVKFIIICKNKKQSWNLYIINLKINIYIKKIYIKIQKLTLILLVKA